jgi:hypothetical protein
MVGNPYAFDSEAANTTTQDRIAQVRISQGLWVLYFYPVIAKILFCTPWFLTWIQDGKYPTPMISGPNGVLGYCSWVIGFTAFASVPFCTPLGLVSAWNLSKQAGSQRRGLYATTLIAIYLMICYVIYLMIVHDPFTIIVWWQD